jgi:hypothetical protein
MVYFQLAAFIVGVVILSALPLGETLAPWGQAGVWLALFLLFMVLIWRRLGRWKLREVALFVTFFASVWTLFAVPMALHSASRLDYAQRLVLLGPVKALRFGCCLAYAILVVAAIDARGLLGVRLIPRSWRVFLLVFRSSLPRLHSLLSGAIDLLMSFGFPPLKEVVVALLFKRRPYPTFSESELGRGARLRLFGISVRAVLVYWIVTIIAEEVPEMEANVQRMTVGVKGG